MRHTSWDIITQQDWADLIDCWHTRSRSCSPYFSLLFLVTHSHSHPWIRSALSPLIWLHSKPSQQANPTRQTKLTTTKKSAIIWNWNQVSVLLEKKQSQCKGKNWENRWGATSSLPSIATNCQTSYPEIHKRTLGVLLDFNYNFLPETTQNYKY